MYVECRHLTPSGRKCTHAQTYNSSFCVFHRDLEGLMHAPAPRPGSPFRMPLLEDAQGCMMGVQQVCWAMGDKRITQKEAGTYLYAVTIAKSLLPKRPAVSRNPVRALCYDNDGFEMAEAVNACEPPRDCLTCENLCHWYEYYEDEVEELEEQMAEEEEQKKLEARQKENPAAESSAGNAPQQPEAEKPKSWADQFPNDRPQVRALLRIIEADALAKEEEAKRKEAEKQAQLQAKKEPQPDRQDLNGRECLSPELAQEFPGNRG